MTSNMEPRKSVAEMLDTIKCDPVAIMAEMALGETPCGRCRGVGRTKFQRSCLKDGKERTCEDCNGSGKERITPELRAKMTRELAQYVSPSTLAGPATEKMLDLLKSGDAVACQAAKAIVERLERLATTTNHLSPVVKGAILDALAKQGISATITEVNG